MLFSKRNKLAIKTVGWCEEHNIQPTPFNIVTAIDSFGFLNETIDILISVGGMIDELESLGNIKGSTIYNICHRNAGWAIQWHELPRQGKDEDWHKGLVIYRYYPTLSECVNGEFVRLG